MNSEMPKQLKKWEVTRQQGKKKFLLQTGILFWGVPMFVIMTFFVHLPGEKPLTGGIIAFSAVVFIITGACYGWAVWSISEKKYQRFLADRKPE